MKDKGTLIPSALQHGKRHPFKRRIDSQADDLRIVLDRFIHIRHD